MDSIADNVARVRERIFAVLARTGRAGGEVTVVAVTKTFPAETVRQVIRAGIPDVGENRVQELVAKAAEVELPCRWHLVGPLQRNKAAKALDVAHLIQAIDGVRIAQAVDRLAGERGMRARVLLEVNTSGESAKHGVVPADAPAVADEVAACRNLEWLGLMTIGPVTIEPVATRACFRSLVALAEVLRGRTGLELPHLSMGMSDDFEIALEEGATILRLGRVITGARPGAL